VKFTETAIRDVWILELEPHVDARGVFVEGFVKEALAARGVWFDVRMANLARSSEGGTVRGLHWQEDPWGQGKIVYAVSGRAFDAAVDVRPDSPSFGKIVTVELWPLVNAVLLPRGVAHGWQALEDGSSILYLLDAAYKPEAERGVRFDDADLAIPWPIRPELVSQKDQSWPKFRVLQRV
jgi:dTDP-4-dehydrorhamnose 3,5-epimerase